MVVLTIQLTARLERASQAYRLIGMGRSSVQVTVIHRTNYSRGDSDANVRAIVSLSECDIKVNNRSGLRSDSKDLSSQR